MIQIDRVDLLTVEGVRDQHQSESRDQDAHRDQYIHFQPQRKPDLFLFIAFILHSSRPLSIVLIIL